MSNRIRILIADDHQIVRMGLTTIFAKEADIAVVGEARNGREAVQQARECSPDVILMDLMMPRMNGVEATRRILAGDPSAKILVLTTFGASEEVEQALSAGAYGALIKDTPHMGLVAAIRTVANGQRIVSPEIQKALVENSSAPKLSERQREVLRLVADGLTTKAISAQLGIGPDGVNAHLRAVFAKLGTSSRTEAVARALKMNLLRG